MTDEEVIAALNAGTHALVPVIPTEKMIKEAWADALAEDAAGVWREMVEAGRVR